MTRNPSTAATAVAAASTAGLALTYLLAVRTHVGQLVDTRSMVAVANVLAGATWAEMLLLAISPVSTLLAAGSLAAGAGALRGGRSAAMVLVTVIGTAVGAVVLKTVLTRPQLLDDAANSLPSGHVAAVAGVAAAATVVAAPAGRRWILGAGAAAVVLTGLATVALRWHRPSDVLASALLAVGVAALARAVFEVVPAEHAVGAREESAANVG